MHYSIKILILLSFFFFLECKINNIRQGPSENYIGWLLKYKNAVITEDLTKDLGPFTTRNVTRFFFPVIDRVKEKYKTKNMTWEKVGLDGKVFEEFKQKYYFVIVPGLLTKFYPFYLDGIEKILKNLEIEVSRAPIDTSSTIELNAKVIKEYVDNKIAPIIKGTGKKIVFISHSKGCNDATDTLLFYPEICDCVGGIINMQGPFGGSAIANDLEYDNITQKIADFVIKDILRGNPNSLKNLEYPERVDFYTKLFKDTYYPLDKIPVFSFASYSKLHQFSALYPLTEYTNLRYNRLSDGMVMDLDAILPKTNFVHVPGFDHASPGFDSFPNVSGYDNGYLALSLLYLWESTMIKHSPPFIA